MSDKAQNCQRVVQVKEREMHVTNSLLTCSIVIPNVAVSRRKAASRS